MKLNLNSNLNLKVECRMVEGILVTTGRDPPPPPPHTGSIYLKQSHNCVLIHVVHHRGGSASESQRWFCHLCDAGLLCRQLQNNKVHDRLTQPQCRITEDSVLFSKERSIWLEFSFQKRSTWKEIYSLYHFILPHIQYHTFRTTCTNCSLEDKEFHSFPTPVRYFAAYTLQIARCAV